MAIRLRLRKKASERWVTHLLDDEYTLGDVQEIVNHALDDRHPAIISIQHPKEKFVKIDFDTMDSILVFEEE